MCSIISGQHHQSICTMHETNSLATNRDAKAKVQERFTMTSAASTTKRHVLLQTAHATAVRVDGSKSVAVKILFDSGSQRSYITDSLRSKLDLKPEKSETLHLNTFGDSKYKTQKCQVFTLNFKTCHDEILPISALNFPVICTPFETKFDISEYPHLQDLDLADSPSDDQRCINVLIGSDHYWDFITREVIQGENGPLAIASKFGWVLSGPSDTPAGFNDIEVTNNLVISGGSEFDYSNETRDEIMHELKRFWDVEAIGICDEGMGESNSVSSELFSDVVFNGQRYKVSLPWKHDRLPLPSNYESCNSRLLSLHRKL